MMEIDTDEKFIRINCRLENWGHVRWLITFVAQNGEMLWGKDCREQKKSAAGLSFVMEDPDDDGDSR